MRTKVVKKGYTLKVVSWENDADYYNTRYYTTESREEAKALYYLMQMCKSKNNRRGEGVGLGNTHGGFSHAQQQRIINFFKENPILVKAELEINKNITDEQYLNYFGDISCDLLGSSEFYDCRVMENCTVTYSESDIYVEEITF